MNKPSFTNRQLLAVIRLLENLKSFSEKGYGSINELFVMYNKALPNTIIVKYEKTFVSAGQPDYEYRIAAIGNDGEIQFVDNRFKDVFERSAFLSECKPFDIEDTNSYDKID